MGFRCRCWIGQSHPIVVPYTALHLNSLLQNKIRCDRLRHSGASRNPAAPRLRRERLSIALTTAGREFVLFLSLPLASWIPVFAGMTLAAKISFVIKQCVNVLGSMVVPSNFRTFHKHRHRERSDAIQSHKSSPIGFWIAASPTAPRNDSPLCAAWKQSGTTVCPHA
ncbi:MAG: hypothetical protein ABTQ34_03910 [Bdellovibrionales bacterium]